MPSTNVHHHPANEAEATPAQDAPQVFMVCDGRAATARRWRAVLYLAASILAGVALFYLANWFSSRFIVPPEARAGGVIAPVRVLPAPGPVGRVAVSPALSAMRV